MEKKIITAFLTTIELLSIYSGKDVEQIIAGLGFTEQEYELLKKGAIL